MTPFLWISLASLVGAVVVMGIVTRYAIREMLAADLRALGATENYRLESVRAEQLRTALADEKRLHRLLLARREAKKRAKVEELGEFVEHLPITRQNSEPHAHARFEPIAGTPTTEAGAST